MRRRLSARSRFRCEPVHCLDEVIDCTNRLEILGGNLQAGLSAQPIHEVYGIDAVDLKVAVKVGIERYATPFDLEQLSQRSANAFKDFNLCPSSHP